MQNILLSTAYLPNIHYLWKILTHDKIHIEQHEHFVKQTLRNRCEIYSSNGKQILSIPLIKQADKEFIKDKKISYAENWQKQHWRAITSAYKNSPYFEFFEDDLKPFYETQYEYLIEYNTALLKTLLHILRIKKEFLFTNLYEPTPHYGSDARFNSQTHQPPIQIPSYYQVFAKNYGYISNLSCIDMIFHIGLETIDIKELTHN